jgi:hypothetical protein
MYEQCQTKAKSGASCVNDTKEKKKKYDVSCVSDAKRKYKRQHNIQGETHVRKTGREKTKMLV